MEIKVTGCTMTTGNCPFLDSEYDSCNITHKSILPTRDNFPEGCPLLTENILVVKDLKHGT